MSHLRKSIVFIILVFCLLLRIGVANEIPPAYKVVEIGRSVGGLPIKATIWNENGNKPILIMCAMHGDEVNAAKLGLYLDREWRAKPELLKGVYVVLIPIVNPDGVKKLTRANANGVDLNRNFPINWRRSSPAYDVYGGAKPLSEPESLMLVELLKDRTPSKIISIHNRRRLEGEPLNLYDGSPRALVVAKKMSKYNNYRVSRGIGYPVPGSFAKYARRKYGVVFNTLEMPSEGDFDNVIGPANAKAVLEAIF